MFLKSSLQETPLVRTKRQHMTSRHRPGGTAHVRRPEIRLDPQSNGPFGRFRGCGSAGGCACGRIVPAGPHLTICLRSVAPDAPSVPNLTRDDALGGNPVPAPWHPGVPPRTGPPTDTPLPPPPLWECGGFFIPGKDLRDDARVLRAFDRRTAEQSGLTEDNSHNRVERGRRIGREALSLIDRGNLRIGTGRPAR